MKLLRVLFLLGIMGFTKLFSATSEAKDPEVQFLLNVVFGNVEGARNVLKAINAEELASLINKQGGKTQNSALHIAAGNGNVEMVKFLLEYKPTLETKNSEGQTPYDIAVEMKKKRQEEYEKSMIGYEQVIGLLRPKTP